MKYRDAIKHFAKKPWIRPAGIVMAFDQPEPLNSVHIAGTLRYRIVQKITRQEFMEQLRANEHHANAVATQAFTDGSKIDIESANDMPEPDQRFKYFYRAECL